jgi:lactoylglutathione lyase
MVVRGVHAMKNEHTAFQVSNMDESLAFYTQKLGLRLISREINPEEQEEYAFLELEGGDLELIQRVTDAPFVRPSLRPPYCPHFAMATDDMARTVAMIKAAGIPIVKGPLAIAGVETWIYVSDPDNNVLEFIQWYKVNPKEQSAAASVAPPRADGHVRATDSGSG